MKKIVPFYLFFLFTFLMGCNEKDTSFTLNGNITGLKSDTLLVFHQVPENQLDTIIAEKGKFNYTFSPDTFTIFSLLLDSTKTYPIYADKGEKVKIYGSLDSLRVEGNGENQLLGEILKQLEKTDSLTLRKSLDSIIKSNPYSFTNLHLIEKYYVQDGFSDYDALQKLIGGLSGIIKDTPYMMNLQAKVENQIKRNRNRNIYTLLNKDRNGEGIKWASISDQYILLDFWASWNPESVAAQDSLVPVLDKLKKKNFLVVSISLDLDKQAWLKAISERDTTHWKQLCDFTGWNNNLIKDQGIRELPSNILLNPHKQIIARDIRGEKLIEKVQQQIKQDEEREKREKARKNRKYKRI